MKLRELYNNVVRGDYDNIYNFPSLDLKGDERSLAIQKYKQYETDCYNKFIHSIKIILSGQDYNYTDSQINLVFNYAWSQSHSNGYLEVLNTLIEITDLINDFNR